MSNPYRKLLILAIALSFPLGASATTYSTIVLGQGNTNNGQNALQVIAEEEAAAVIPSAREVSEALTGSDSPARN